MKLVLIGAGSAQFGLGTLGDFFQSEKLYGSEIVLVDINGEALSVVHGKAKAFLAEHPLPFTVSATTDRKLALAHADFVIISIEVGNRFKLWDEDWTIPQQYGIRQVYGENGGAGGVFHALRIAPVIMEICDDVAAICPDAWVFNYSNPMTAITTAVLRKHPGLKFVGLCHEVVSLERYLPSILDTPFENLELRSAGLNHFSVLLEARYRDSGKDAYPDILEKAPAFFEREIGYSDILSYVMRTGKAPRTEGNTHRVVLDVDRSAKSWSDRTLFKEIMETYKLMPVTVDSHFGEYIPWAPEVVDHRGIKDFYTLYQLELAQVKPKIELRRDERMVLIIEGILGDSGYEEPAVNVMNDGLIDELPSNIAVEVPAKVHRSSLEPIAFPNYPKGFAALLRNYCGVYDLTADAVLTGKKEYVVHALLANPAVGQYRVVGELVDLMIERQRRWLGYLS
ncbi:MAG: alpha-glucosidase [Spirochaetes bacterium GWC2_52_13]|nr:MAG: alpha-glucosidase [Spirochaetes bacterium GWC2_52_13]HCG64184.1 alpha-glucosidase [Sphaerochaeta sp.]